MWIPRRERQPLKPFQPWAINLSFWAASTALWRTRFCQVSFYILSDITILYFTLHVASLHFNVVRRFVVRLQFVEKKTESQLEFVCSPLASSVYIGFSSVFLNQRTSLTLSSASVARLQGSEAGPPAITATWATEAGTRRYRHVYGTH